MKMKVNHVTEDLDTPAEFDAFLNELDNAVIGKLRHIDVCKILSFFYCTAIIGFKVAHWSAR